MPSEKKKIKSRIDKLIDDINNENEVLNNLLKKLQQTNPGNKAIKIKKHNR